MMLKEEQCCVGKLKTVFSRLFVDECWGCFKVRQHLRPRIIRCVNKHLHPSNSYVIIQPKLPFKEEMTKLLALENKLERNILREEFLSRLIS